MRLHGNTILITGGGTGIGRGLAEAFHQRGNQVILCGRREDVLRETCAANPGMEWLAFDVADAAQLRAVAASVTAKFPALNCVINNAGIQRAVDFAADEIDCAIFEAEIATNLSGLVRMCAAFLPHLRRQPSAALMNVSSGLGLTPLARVPVYSATKAAVHSFSCSLRHQLKGSSVEVIELIPPAVESALRAGRKEDEARGPRPMPLAEYIAETMAGLERGEVEVAVGTAKFGLAAAANAEWRKIFAMMNP